MVSIVIANYNGEKYLRRNLNSLLSQGYPDLEIIMVDNAGVDGSVGVIEREYPQVRVIKNKKNLGFCVANNQGIKLSGGQYVMLLNQDTELAPDYIGVCAEFLDRHQNVGAVQGKMLRMNFGSGEKTQIIDSVGIEIFKNGRMVSRGENQIDQGQFDQVEEVFGADGAAVLFRREALESIKILDEYEDEDFFMYKDDVDYSWRLRLKGWKIWYLPRAVVYHGRTSSGTGREGSYLGNILAYIQSERQKKDYVAGLSFKNQWLMLIKNLTWQQFLRQMPFVFFREFQLFLFNLVFRPKSFLKYGLVFLQQLPRALRKRRIVQSQREISSEEIQKWFR